MNRKALAALAVTCTASAMSAQASAETGESRTPLSV